jgi:hypothetical protein
MDNLAYLIQGSDKKNRNLIIAGQSDLFAELPWLLLFCKEKETTLSH